MLNVAVEDLGQVVTLHCKGSIVRGEETRVLCAAVGYHGRDVILDLRDVHIMDAAGIGALIALQTAGVYLKLENPTPAVRELLHVTGMDSVFEIIEADVESKSNASIWPAFPINSAA
jgi:anti-anti-sigma factor